MIITVEGRPLNGPLIKSNTLKEKEPLMKGGGMLDGIARGPLAQMVGASSGTPVGLQSRQQGKDAYQEAMPQREPSQASSQTAKLFSDAAAGKPITESQLNENMGILRHISLEEAQEYAEEAIRNAARHTKRMNRIHSYLLSMLFYYLFYLTGPYIRESVGLFFYWAIKLFLNFFSLLILFIIFNICLIIIMVIQKSLNISHAVVGGIANGMQNAIDKAGFRIFGKNIKFLGFLQGPTNKVKAADDKIPRTARQVIEAIVYSFFAPYLK